MKILFDLAASQPVGSIKFHGGAEYTKTVFFRLLEEKNAPEVEVFYDSLREIDEQLIRLSQVNNIKVHAIQSLTELNDLIIKNDYDVFYSALPDAKYAALSIPSKTRFIFTQHGLRGMELMNDKYQTKYITGMKNRLKITLSKLKPDMIVKRRKEQVDKIFNLAEKRTIITVSNHSKSSILKFFPQMRPEEIVVAASPHKLAECKTDSQKEQDILKKFNVSHNKYILLVSADRWEKNNYRAVQALNKALNTRPDIMDGYKILVLGAVHSEMYRKIISEGNLDKFNFVGYVESDELEILYKNAYSFVYPSLNEGFGYPPIEAMKYQTVSLCAADSAITEVCGDSVLYFNPYNIEEMVIRIIESFDPDVYQMMIEKGKQHLNDVDQLQKKGLQKIVDILCGRIDPA